MYFYILFLEWLQLGQLKEMLAHAIDLLRAIFVNSNAIEAKVCYAKQKAPFFSRRGAFWDRFMRVATCLIQFRAVALYNEVMPRLNLLQKTISSRWELRFLFCIAEFRFNLKSLLVSLFHGYCKQCNLLKCERLPYPYLFLSYYPALSYWCVYTVIAHVVCVYRIIRTCAIILAVSIVEFQINLKFK